PPRKSAAPRPMRTGQFKMLPSRSSGNSQSARTPMTSVASAINGGGAITPAVSAPLPCCPSLMALTLISPQRRCEIGNEIIGILDADRKPHQRVANAERRAHLGWHRAMRHQRRMLDQALDAA